MAFPTTGILDDFNRADVGPPPSASWTVRVGGHKVLSNVLVGTGGGDNYNWWSDNTFGPDSECFCTVATKPADGIHVAGVGVRFAGATNSGYEIEPKTEVGTDSVILYRVDAGVYTQIGSTLSQEFSAGDSFGLEAVGTTLTIYYKPAAGPWASLGSATDATYSSAGNLQIYSSGTIGAMDDFGGGTVVVAARGATALRSPSFRQPFGLKSPRPNKERQLPQLQGTTPPSVTVTIPIRGPVDDGSWQYTDTVWPPSAGTGAAFDGNIISVQKTFSTPNYQSLVGLLRFDTTVIPPDAVVTSAILKLNAQGRGDANGFSVVGEYYAYGGEPSQAVDWIETISGTSIFTPRRIDTTTIPAGYNSFDLNNLSGINKLGYTGIRLTLTAGVPTGTNFLSLLAQEFGEATAPQLIVTYIPAGVPASAVAPTPQRSPSILTPYGLRSTRLLPAVGGPSRVSEEPFTPLGITFQRGPSFRQPFGMVRPRQLFRYGASAAIGPFVYDKSGEGISGFVASGASELTHPPTGVSFPQLAPTFRRPFGLRGPRWFRFGTTVIAPITYDKAGGGVSAFVGSGASAFIPAPVTGLGGGGDANAGRRDFSYLTGRRSPLEMRHLIPDIQPESDFTAEDLSDLATILILLA